MSDQVITVTVKGIGDFSDVVSNVGSVQKALTKLKLPDKLGDSLNKNITAFYKEYEKYQKKITEGVKTQGDYNQVEKSLNNMRSLYQAIGKDAQKLTQLDMKDMLNLDTGEVKKIMDELTSVVKQIGSVKIDTTPFTKAFADIRSITKNSKISGDNGLLSQIIGSVNTGQIAAAKKQLQELENYAKKVAPRTTETGARMPGTLSAEKYQQLTAAIGVMNGAVAQAEAAMNPLIERQNDLQKELDETKQKAAQGIKNEFDGYNQASDQVDNLTESLKRMHQEEFSFNREAQNIDRQIQSYFGLSQMIRKVGDIAKDAFATVKELDKAMTETAVVTNFSVGDMWEMLPTYTAQANQLGSTIKDVYDAATLYYQQGLNTNQAMSLANETLKMARIAGLDAADATNMMTAALRGFNMEINQQSAQKINDIYSELAAITASDTKEIGSAMERTASIANSANMEFATTSAFLAQMIETTREAPENLGTAMKTIVARFQEMKQDPTKLIDSEGVAMDANKVDKALKTIGVQLMDTKGEFRDLDDVFLEIASKWDSLSQGQQRYIATIAAGSRQQSRFIAMMSNYERTMELVDAANNSAGASQRQFEKTLDSMEAKLNKLKNAWDQFTMGLMNNQILKFGVDALTEGFTIINKFIDILGKIPPKPFEGVTKSLLTLVSTVGLLKLGGRGASAISGGIFGWLSGEGFSKGFNAGWARPGKNSQPGGETNKPTNGIIKQSQFSAPIVKDINSGKIANAIVQQFNKAKQQINSIPWNTTIAVDNLIDQSALTAEGKEAGHKLWLSIQQEVNNGTLKPELATIAFQNRFQGNIDFTQLSGEEERVEQLSSRFDGLGTKISSAGMSLQQFGSVLQGTPLEPFGNFLTRIGTLMVTVGDTAVKVGRKLVTAFMEAKTASVAAGGGLSGLKAGASAFIGVFTKIPPHILLIIAAIAAAIAVVHHFATANKRALEAVTDAAAAASEAYDSAKQETSELADAIEQVKTNEDAFDGLVVGTAAFNEQLVTANDQIMELIKKYPMLNDYLTTDKNGLMHISDEGLNAIKEYQKQRQANASALNLIQTADLNSEETRQKAAQMRKVKGTDTTETLKQRQQEADLLEQQAKAQADMAKVNAVNTALVDKEIHNREKVSAIMAEQYDARKNAVNLEGESIHDLKQEYADFYGYKYDKSTKKLTDVEGNEIDVDKATIKDAVKEIRVITNFEADGKSLDSMLNSIDSKFSNALGDTFAESGNLFSDIMSNNIDIDGDLLENLITNPDKLQSAVDALSEKEIAAVLGVSADAVAEAPDKYKNELTDKLAKKATNIAETQAQSYADLASMLAQTTSADVSKLIDENGQATTNAQKANQQAIKEQLDKLTTEQKNTLSSIGNALSEGAGAETMRTFIRQATDIYTKGTQESITTLDNIIKDVNWSSPTARLKAYNDMINSADKDVQNLGNSLRNSSESSNLLGEAFEEFYDSSDFQEMAENMDKFADSSGKLNATSIQEMAKECGSLNNLLDTGAISAGGVAAALNAMGADGNITILDLNENLLKFLSTANQLEDTLAEAHSLIENFDWGVDTGESEDFAKDSTKKWKDLYDNGEFGNQQLENYAKFVLGQERWNKELEKSGGNIETALNNMSKDILKYSDGFEQAWIDMANSNAIQDVHYGENGDIIWDTKGKTTQELVEWLAETRGITQEWAKLMVEDFANYSYDFKTELQNNDFTAALKNGDYIKAHQGKDNTTNITQSEIVTLAAAQNKTEAEILKDIQTYGKISEDELNVIKNIDENGNLLMGNGDIASLNKQYSQAELGMDTTKSWISQYVAQTRQGQVIEGSTDLKAAISAAIADGLPDQQATEMARTEGLKAWEEGAKVFYDGVELQKEDLADSQAFADKITEITENSRWNAVGEAIAQGYINYIQGIENPNQSTDSNKNGTSDWEPASYGNKGSNITIGTPIEDPKEEARRAAKEKFDSWIQGLKEGTNTPTEDPKIAAGEKSRQRWSELWTSIKKAFTSSTSVEDPKVEASEKARENWSNIWTSVKNAFTSGTSVKDPKVEAGNKAKEVWKGIWDKVKQALSANPEINPNVSSNKKGQENIEVNSTGTTKVTFTGEIANPEELKTSLQTQIASILKSVTAQTQKLQASVNATVNYKSGTQAKAKKQTTTVDYKKGKQDKASSQSAVVNYTLGSQAPPQPKNTTVNYTLGSQANPKPKTVDISPHFVGSWTKTITLNPSRAKGINNKITTTALPNFGSLAKGSRYGRLGPRGRGGLTLTGEEGFEIAWLPSESRSMILGANGPQMINLPSDAVVYTHEQSKDILRKKQTIDAGSHAGRHISGSSPSSSGSSKSKSGGSSGSRGSSSSKSSSSSNSNPNESHFSIEEVIRFDYDKTLETLASKIKKTTDQIEKNLNKIGVTAKDVSGVIQDQMKNLEATKQFNEKLIASYQKDLDAFDKNKYMMTVSYSTGGGKNKDSKEYTFDAQWYVYQGADGQYQINENAIKKLGNKELEEAVFKAVEGVLNSLASGLLKAQDAAYEAQKQIDDLNKKLVDAFYMWKNELTEIYNLSQQISMQSAMQDRFSSQTALELARLSAGFGDTAQSIAIMTQANTRNNQSLVEQIKRQQSLIDAREREINAFATGTDEIARLMAFKNMGIGSGENQFATQALKDAAIAEAEQKLRIVELARQYMVGGTPVKNADGTITYDIDWEKFEQDSIGMSSETAKAIKEFFDQLESANVDYNNSIKESAELLKSTYDKLKEYQNYLVDFEDTLLHQLEEQAKEEIDNAKESSESISNALKDLFDEVKRRLNERRQQEDNAKTERDIAQKQQRLAALRADTSGGHQVEIAQLQKEIADSQQSYGRTLEDQLLERLQQQGDEAAAQRTRQIELAEYQATLQEESNKEQLALWLRNPANYRKEIKELWMEAQDYDSKGLLGQAQSESTFESSFAELVQAAIESESETEENKLAKALGATTIVNSIDSIGDTISTQQTDDKNFHDEVVNAFGEIFKIFSDQKTALSKVTDLNVQSGPKKIDNAKVNKLVSGLEPDSAPDSTKTTDGFIDKKLVEKWKKGNITKKQALQAGADKDIVETVYKTPKETTPPPAPEPTSKATSTTSTNTPKGPSRISEVSRDLKYGHKGNDVKLLQQALNALKYRGSNGSSLAVDGDFGPNTLYAVKRFQSNSSGVRADGVVGPATKKAFKKKGYKKGGLADFTGPAWLDGTPSKPELVLNATDTKNFLALRDVLSSAMKSTSTVSNSYGGDVMYDINIHVDKIEKDYDVDRVVDKVKKEITKGAGYRNVTQVRNFR